MFSTTNLFRKVVCPQGPSCPLPNCIFSHEFDLGLPAKEHVSTNQEQDDFQDRTRVKRRKIEDNAAPASTGIEGPVAIAIAGKTLLGPQSDKATASTDKKTKLSSNALHSAKREISPPPARDAKRAKTSGSNTKTLTPEKPVSLNPRLLTHDPAGHDKRRLYIQKLYESLVRLNGLVVKSKDPANKQFILTDNELKRLALDEEERFATENASVYANVIKHRLVAYSRMSFEDWLARRRSSQTDSKSKKTEMENPFPPFKSELNAEQELLILPRLKAYLPQLSHEGYVVDQVSDTDIAAARKGVVDKDYMEECDQCRSKFQVYTERRESDGALTSNGPCVHHPARAQFPRRNQNKKGQGNQEKIHPCCNEPEGSRGCATRDNHAFVIKKSPGRLASILPFESTPTVNEAKEDGTTQKPAAVAFDCEMGYTVNGLELIRLTATEWQTGKELLDVLVRPLGPIIDFNSRFSGVWPKDFQIAIPYEGVTPPPPRQAATEENDKSKRKALPIVPDPQTARTLLLSLLTPDTPLIGHGLENDLNAVRLIHPTIVDTVLLFPHHRGLPYRRSLRELADNKLGWSIQKGGKAGATTESNEGGHDSKEDARAAAELVRVAVEWEWRKIKAQGWRMEGGKLVPPPGKTG
ncbi:MAG: RNA exonuclease 3 [Bathelium mastoideum]|nr:MAG: RNA exonuclease 3 [Bathelium mastoideum]